MSWIPDIRTPEREIGQYSTSDGETPPQLLFFILVLMAFVSVSLFSLFLWAIWH